MGFVKSLPPLAQIAKNAGDRIATMQDNIVQHNNLIEKHDKSRLTPADVWANVIVCEGLEKHFPGVAIVSEENSKQENANALLLNTRIEADPLDNTTGYTKGRDGYSVNIGLIENGVPVEGVIYFPARKELYYTDNGKAYLQRDDAAPEEIRVKGLPLADTLKVAVGFNEQNIEHITGRQAEVEQHPAQMRTCMVMQGKCHLTGVNKGVGGFNTYDIAGPHAVLRAAGGDIIEAKSKKPFRYKTSAEDPTPMKVPDHIAGGVDTLVALGLMEPQPAKGQKLA